MNEYFLSGEKKAAKVIAEAFKLLLAKPKYKMSPALARSTYNSICRVLGLEPAKLKLP